MVAGAMEEVGLRDSGMGVSPAAVPDQFFADDTGEVEAGVAREPDAAPEPGVAPEPAEEMDPSTLDRDFDLYVNPFLGSGGLLSKALGLQETYQCGDCGGQVCLRITRDPRLEGKAVVGVFLCSRCGTPV